MNISSIILLSLVALSSARQCDVCSTVTVRGLVKAIGDNPCNTNKEKKDCVHGCVQVEVKVPAQDASIKFFSTVSKYSAYMDREQIKGERKEIYAKMACLLFILRDKEIRKDLIGGGLSTCLKEIDMVSEMKLF